MPGSGQQDGNGGDGSRGWPCALLMVWCPATDGGTVGMHKWWARMGPALLTLLMVLCPTAEVGAAGSQSVWAWWTRPCVLLMVLCPEADGGMVGWQGPPHCFYRNEDFRYSLLSHCHYITGH